MRIGIIGDTQGRYDMARLLEQVAAAFADVDEVWHAGDWQYQEVLDGLRKIGKPLVIVNGNAPDDPAYPEQVLRRFGDLAVGMVHRPPRRGDPWAAELDICIHGHTHQWRDEVIGRTRFINVSTATAAGFRSDRTAGILDLGSTPATLTRVEFVR